MSKPESFSGTAPSVLRVDNLGYGLKKSHRGLLAAVRPLVLRVTFVLASCFIAGSRPRARTLARPLRVEVCAFTKQEVTLHTQPQLGAVSHNLPVVAGHTSRTMGIATGSDHSA